MKSGGKLIEISAGIERRENWRKHRSRSFRSGGNLHHCRSPFWFHILIMFFYQINTNNREITLKYFVSVVQNIFSSINAPKTSKFHRDSLEISMKFCSFYAGL